MPTNENRCKQIIGDNLWKLSSSNNLVLRDISVNTGVSKSHLSGIESGQTFPSIRTLLILGDFFNVPIRDFFLNNGDPASQHNKPDHLTSRIAKKLI